MHEQARRAGAGRERSSLPAPTDEPHASPQQRRQRLLGQDRLLAALDRHLTSPPAVVVLRAGPGSGKSAVLCAWAAAQPAGSVRWVDVARLPSARQAAVIDEARRTAPARVGRSMLVLDHVDHLVDREAQRLLEDMVRHPVAGEHLLLVGRGDPPLELATQRLAGEVDDLDAAQLALSTAEYRALFAAAGVELGDRDLAETIAWLAGCVAAAKLLAEALATSADHSSTLTALRDRSLPLLPYAGEQLPALADPDLADVLDVLAIADEVPIDLAVSLTGRSGAGNDLERLHSHDGLLARDGQAYRAPGWLQGVLRARLALRDPARTTALHAAAAQWWRQQGQPTTALSHAARAEAGDVRDHVIGAVAMPLLLAGAAAPVLTAVESAAPQPSGSENATDVVGAQGIGAPAAWPTLVAVVAALEFAPDRLSRYLAAFDALDPATLAPSQQVLWASATLQARRIHAMSEDTLAQARKLAGQPSADAAIDAYARAALAQAAFWSGDLAGAQPHARGALERARANGWPWLAALAHALLAGCSLAVGDLPASEQHVAVLETLIGTHGESIACTNPAVQLWLHLATAAHIRGDVEAATRYHRAASRILDRGFVPTDTGYLLLSRWLAAANAFDTGDNPREALRECEAAWESVGAARVSPVLLAVTVPSQLDMALRIGDYGTARRVLTRAIDSFGDCAETRVLRARWHLARGQRNAAATALRELREGLVPSALDLGSQLRTPLLAVTLVQSHLLMCAIEAARGNEAAARLELQDALELGARAAVHRPFLDAGSEIDDLLARYPDQFATNRELVGWVRLERQRIHGRDGHSPRLTPREMEMLNALASPATLEEIAAGERVSVNTVKTHVRHIYRKLGVRNRRDAVALARGRFLL